MLHPLFSTLIQRPDLIVDHVAGYAQLLQEEATQASGEVVSRVVAWFAAAVLGMMFLGLSGVAIMVGVLNNQFHWVLIAVPGVALVAAAMAVLRAKKPFMSEKFPEFRAQIDSDIRALRSVA
jgi:hypothetical protein